MSTATAPTTATSSAERDAVVATLQEALEALKSSERAFDDLREQVRTDAQAAAAALRGAKAFLFDHDPLSYDRRPVAVARASRVHEVTSAAQHAESLVSSVVLDADGVHVTDNLVSLVEEFSRCVTLLRKLPVAPLPPYRDD